MVYVTVQCPSVRLSVPSIDSSNVAGGFAAELPASRRYRATAFGYGAVYYLGAQQRRHRSTVLNSKCGQCRVDSRRRMLNTDLLL